MIRAQGNILIIVLLIVSALYLLASMMFVVNQQYFSDVFMMKMSTSNRQKLLSAGQKNIQTMTRSFLNRDASAEWEECDVLTFPDMAMDGDTFSNKSQLTNRCYDGHLAYRIWLASLDNMNDRLVMDQLVEKNDWQHEIDDEWHFVDIQDADNAWKLIMHNGVFDREIVLIESDVLPKLIEQKMRVNELHYELMFVFEDDIAQQIMFYHLWVPIAELQLDVGAMFQFHLNQYSTDDHVDLVTMNVNDANNPNWQMTMDQNFFESIVIKSNVMFSVLHSKNSTHQSIIGMHLKGAPFFDERLAGFEYETEKAVVELIPCLYHSPLIVAERWQIGCDVQQKIRYYFPQ